MMKNWHEANNSEPYSSVPDNTKDHVSITTSGMSDVYARLYDKRSYTGVYRKRFEETRDDQQIHDLSCVMRPNLNHNEPRKKAFKLSKPSPKLRTRSTSVSIPSVAEVNVCIFFCIYILLCGDVCL